MRNGAAPLPPDVTADNDHVILVVRMDFSGKDLADDTDNLLRFSSGAVRLMTGQPDSAGTVRKLLPGRHARQQGRRRRV